LSDVLNHIRFKLINLFYRGLGQEARK